MIVIEVPPTLQQEEVGHEQQEEVGHEQQEEVGDDE
jgi:hypothetical protein